MTTLDSSQQEVLAQLADALGEAKWVLIGASKSTAR
jgi:hypothetical protein